MFLLGLAVAQTQLLSGGIVFNGGKTQVNFTFPASEGAYPFINYLKLGDRWIFGDNSDFPLPTTLDVNGYPTTVPAAGLKILFNIPTNAEYSGQWVLKWVGTGTMGFSGTSFTFVSCNVTCTSNNYAGTNGRVVVTVASSSVSLLIKATDATVPISSLAFVRADEEALYNSGQIFSTLFKSRLSAAKFGVLRDMDWALINTSMSPAWAYRKPVGYITWAGDEQRASIFGGTTTNSGDDYSLAYAPSQSPADKAIVLVRWNASASGTSPTLNGIALATQYGDTPISASAKPTISQYGVVVYDQSLNKWLLFNTSGSSQFLQNGIPPEIFVRLCNELGAHPWFSVPFLALDPPGDYATQLATYTKANLIPTLIPRFEPSNEVWNFGVGFYSTRYAWNKALVRWGTSFDSDNWYGMVSSTMGQAVSAVYGNDRTKYQMISGQMAVATPTTSGKTRVESTLWVSMSGGSAASNWVTHVAPAGYVFPPLFAGTQSLANAFSYSTADAAGQLVLATTYVNSTNIDCGDASPCNGTVQSVGRQTLGWSSWALSNYGLKTTHYEGGVDLSFLTADLTSNINAVTKASQAVVTIATTTATANPLPPVGEQITFSSTVGGMTQIRGLTGTVLSVAGQNVTTDIDSSAFSTYTSGGFVTHVNSQANFNAMIAQGRALSAIKKIEYDHIVTSVANGAEFPSDYTFTGNNAWSSLQTDIYGLTNTAKYDAHVIYNNNGPAP